MDIVLPLASTDRLLSSAVGITVYKAVQSLNDIIDSIPVTEAKIQRANEVADFSTLFGKSEHQLKTINSSLGAILVVPVEISLENRIWEQRTLRTGITEKCHAKELEIKALLGCPADDQIDGKVTEETLKQEGDWLETFGRYFNEQNAVKTLLDNSSFVNTQNVSSNSRTTH